MHARCRYKTTKQYADYGGRGIKICERWNSFECFVSDMGERPPDFVIDRTDNDGDYTPENCRWVSRTESQRNQRVTRKVVISGIEYIAAALADHSGLKTDTIIHRAANGLPFEQVVSSHKMPDMRSEEDRKRAGQRSGETRRKKTHCKMGHEFTPDNTYWWANKYRQCRKCHTARENSRIKF